jgi:hypothetical protein
MIGPVREFAREGGVAVHGGEVLVMEGSGAPDAAKAVLTAVR